MRFWLGILGIVLLIVVGSRVMRLAMSGQLFEPGVLRESWRDFKRDLWLGARVFVILWIAYLILTYLMRTL